MNTGSIKDFSAKIVQTISNEQKVDLIRNFPIANTKEDIFEFMILVSSSITGEYNRAVFNAWLAKFENVTKKRNWYFMIKTILQSLKESMLKQESRFVRKKGFELPKKSDEPYRNLHP